MDTWQVFSSCIFGRLSCLDARIGSCIDHIAEQMEPRNAGVTPAVVRWRFLLWWAILSRGG